MVLNMNELLQLWIRCAQAEELDEEDWFVLNGMPGLVSSSPEEASGALRSGILIGLESAAEGVTAALALSLEAALDSLKPLSPLREFVDSCSALLLVVPLVELGRLTGAMTSLLNLTDAVDPGSSTESLIEVIRAASLNHELLGAAARLT